MLPILDKQVHRVKVGDAAMSFEDAGKEGSGNLLVVHCNCSRVIITFFGCCSECT